MKKNNENPGIAMKIYRIERWFYNHNMKFISKLFYRLNFILFNCSIPPTTKIGSGVIFPHSTGIIIHQNSVIGDNTKIYQNVTIGNNNGPKIGKNCIIGTGACILGDIVIGDNCKVGANAVVLKNIPSNSTAVGVPSKIINTKI